MQYPRGCKLLQQFPAYGWLLVPVTMIICTDTEAVSDFDPCGHKRSKTAHAFDRSNAEVTNSGHALDKECKRLFTQPLAVSSCCTS